MLRSELFKNCGFVAKWLWFAEGARASWSLRRPLFYVMKQYIFVAGRAIESVPSHDKVDNLHPMRADLHRSIALSPRIIISLVSSKEFSIQNTKRNSARDLKS